MKISSFINKESLNSKLSDIILKYDTDQNGLTRDEFSNTIKGMTSVFAKNIIKITGYEKKFFKELDKDKNKIISYDEMAEYIREEYNLDFYSFQDKNISEFCDEMDKAKNNK